jgi:hypothetical protein
MELFIKSIAVSRTVSLLTIRVNQVGESEKALKFQTEDSGTIFWIPKAAYVVPKSGPLKDKPSLAHWFKFDPKVLAKLADDIENTEITGGFFQ